VPAWLPVLAVVVAALLVIAGMAKAVTLLWPDRKAAVIANVADISDEIADGVGSAIAEEFSASAEAANSGDTVILEQLSGEAASPMTVHFVGIAPRKTCYLLGCSRAQTEKERLRTFTAPFTAGIRRALEPGLRRRTPLLENLAALTRLPAYKADDPHTPKVLNIATDLGQFTTCSVYPPRAKSPAGGRKAAAKKAPLVPPLSTEACTNLMRDLRGKFVNTVVQILLIARVEPFQTQELVEAWEKFFLSNGATQVRVRMLK
jgi:hypothetical protein